MAKGQELIGAGAGQEQLLCAYCAQFEDKSAESRKISEYSGDHLNCQSCYRRFRTTPCGRLIEQQLWEKIRYCPKPYFNCEDENHIATQARVTYKAAQAIRDFLIWKKRSFFGKSENERKIACRSWLRSSSEKRYFEEVHIPQLEKDLKTAVLKLNLYDQVLRQMSDADYFDPWEFEELDIKYRNAEREIYTYDRHIGITLNTIKIIDRELSDLQTKYSIV